MSKIAGMNAEFRRREAKLPEGERVLLDEWAKYLVEIDALTRTLIAASWVNPKLKRLSKELQFAHCLRHHAMDELILELIERRGIRRVVVLGAGYDMRPSRFASRLAGVKWIEVDQPRILERKTRILEKLGIDAFVPARFEMDLRSGRLATLADRGAWEAGGEPTLFVAEGLVHYLSVAWFYGMLEDMWKLSSRPVFLFSFMESGMYQYGRPIVGAWLQKLREIPTLHFTREKLSQILKERRFESVELLDASSQISRFAPSAQGRPLSVSQEIALAMSEAPRANH